MEWRGGEEGKLRRVHISSLHLICLPHSALILSPLLSSPSTRALRSAPAPSPVRFRCLFPFLALESLEIEIRFSRQYFAGPPTDRPWGERARADGGRLPPRSTPCRRRPSPVLPPSLLNETDGIVCVRLPRFAACLGSPDADTDADVSCSISLFFSARSLTQMFEDCGEAADAPRGFAKTVTIRTKHEARTRTIQMRCSDAASLTQ